MKKIYPKTEEYEGYYLFETPNSQEYLEFISEFDYTEYEIVNVSGNYSTVGVEKRTLYGNVQKNNITIKAGGSWIAVQLPSAFVIHFANYIF